MARGQWGRQPLVPEAHQALDNMKYEIAAELEIPVYQGSEDYWGFISARDCGAVGGTMTRRLVQHSEKYMETWINN
ncbi:small, acid-soluble spore protein, alpha/beta type [Tepidibacillus sp. LV47]|uniref:small, acid-soluble spore protein, alpha/beta type n=1 Tax=Tepidibacillus sp. LV47 TaxID=3398228 RepID=UPI003AAD484E